MDASRLRNVPFLLWFGSCAGWCVIRIYVLVAYFESLRGPYDGDFKGFLFAARMGVREGWNAVYDQATFMPKAIAATGITTSPFLEPPTTTPVLVALLAIPWPVVAWVWLLIGLVAAGATGWLVSVDQPVSRRIAITAAFIGFFPIWFTLAQGQPNTVPLLGLALGYRLLRADRMVLAGVALSACVLKPQMVVLVPLALMAAGYWRTLAGGAVVALAWAAGSVLLVGPRAVATWIAELQQVNGTRLNATMNTVDFYLPHGFGPVVITAAALAAAFVAWQFRNSDRRPAITIAAGLVASLLATPFADPQDFSAWILAGYLIWSAYPRRWLALLLGLVYFGLNPVGWLVIPSPIVPVEVVALGALCVMAWRLRGREELAPQTIPSSQRASSVIRSGVQGGS